ncbi:putative ABC transport system permease protein [Leifsonia sp. AK011]|uniref:ABC transporter permease n=1 Tax=Leifsonia sp. AK011 TaxID=2723075 RepID=UPI0015CDA8C0|nr:ABC transporter permease [Leifsonia sp. AK011]NYF09540.1 putative ABC transport system permease protein [Leifsonia sp. AK011]
MKRTTPDRVDKSRLRFVDLLALGSAGVVAKPARAVLSALGIAIGVAAMVAVLGISSSSQAKLDERLSELGTNLFSATSAPPVSGDAIPLPANASARADRLSGIEGSAAVGDVSGVGVYRNELVDPGRTGGLTVTAADLTLLDVVGGTVRSGSWLNAATATLPSAVLGAAAAERLGVTEAGTLVWIGDQNVLVTGILDPIPLAPELDFAAFIGMPAAEHDYSFNGSPTRLYLRVDETRVREVSSLIAPAVQPGAAGSVAVTRPSDALAAVDAVDDTFTGMLVGLGSISLLVGAIGVANTMIISVIERRREIGLRRALGATRRHIRLQFVIEALVLSGLGGVAGALIGSLATAVVAAISDWPVVVPLPVLGAGVASTLVVGALAGLYPAMRAAATSPNTALSS